MITKSIAFVMKELGLEFIPNLSEEDRGYFGIKTVTKVKGWFKTKEITTFIPIAVVINDDKTILLLDENRASEFEEKFPTKEIRLHCE